eukprot:2334355-Rhodomonas_salina.1
MFPCPVSLAFLRGFHLLHSMKQFYHARGAASSSNSTYFRSNLATVTVTTTDYWVCYQVP